VSLPSLEPRERYSPHLRTALVFTGSGTAGAYHAGVLRALHEAGVKIDIVGGCGMGVPTALFAAVDASAHLSESDGFWRSPAARRLYPFRRILKLLAACIAVSLLAVIGPLLAAVAGLLVFPVAFFLGMLGLSWGPGASRAVVGWLYTAFEPGALPSLLPRLAVLGLVAAVVVLVIASVRERRRLESRREHARFWWVWADCSNAGPRCANGARGCGGRSRGDRSGSSPRMRI
jgi:hypothetical protein